MELPKRKQANWAKLKTKREPNENTKLYNSLYWKFKRESFWRKPNNQYCAMCSTPRTKGFTCDHVEPVPIGCTITEFIMFTESHKLQALCVTCNARKSAFDRWDKKK